jgi:D-ribulokinase
VRACLIDAHADEVATAQTHLPAPVPATEGIEQSPALWWQALDDVLSDMGSRGLLREVAAIALDGTSATLLACAADGNPLAPALMYNDTRARTEAARITAIAPATSGAHGAHGSLAKALWLTARIPPDEIHHLLHQADWLTGRLCGRFGISDENNALKLGYDPVARRWPDWLDQSGLNRAWLPEVFAPGTPVGTLLPHWAQRWDMPQATLLAGTTDSTAAFLATGADRVGQAVTSLGSTLVLKVLAERPVFAPEYGVYSHRLGERWLVGGASNSGGAVLKQFFTTEQLRALEPDLHPEADTGLDYYPLPGTGERFPINDPQLAPRIAPRPADDARFLQGLLEGIADIERRGYALLHALGAPYPESVISSGGGAANAAWRTLRARRLGVPVTLALHQDAAYGAALLACRA